VPTGADGKDTLAGGAEADRCAYSTRAQSAVGANADRITDFSHAQGDKIDLSAIDASTVLAGNQAFSFIGTALYTASPGSCATPSPAASPPSPATSTATAPRTSTSSSRGPSAWWPATSCSDPGPAQAASRGTMVPNSPATASSAMLKPVLMPMLLVASDHPARVAHWPEPLSRPAQSGDTAAPSPVLYCRHYRTTFADTSCFKAISQKASAPRRSALRPVPQPAGPGTAEKPAAELIAQT